MSTNLTDDTELVKKLERLRDELATEAAQIRRGSVLTLILGLFALAGLSFYFYWGYSQFSEVLQPKQVADTVASLVDDNVPGVRKSLEEEVRKSAPVWAEGLSKQLRENLPVGRKKLEDYVMDRIKATLEQGTVLTSERFAKLIQENKVELRKEAADLAKGQEVAAASIADLEKSLQSQLDTDLKANATELVYILVAFSDKLEKLAKNAKLDQTEAIERRLAMIARRLQSDKIATSDTITKAANAPGTPAPVVAPSEKPKSETAR
jgi:hypothetical protein